MLRHCPIAIGLAALASGQVLYRTEFHDVGGWTFDPPTKNSRWDVDALPATAPHGPFRSPPASLNFNDDTLHYDPDYFPGNFCRSPLIDLGAATHQPVLTFWCNNQMVEFTCDNHESARVQVLRGGSKVLERCLTCASCYQNWAPISPCDYSAWHKHTLPLQKRWGIVQIAFLVQGDDLFNEGAGLLVDDLTVFDAEPTTTYCSGKTSSQGCTPRIEFEGVPEYTPGGPFLLRAPDVINAKLGMLIYSSAGPASTPFQGGLLCVRAPIVRTLVTASGGNPPPDDCSGELAMDFNAWILSGADATLKPGVRVYAQFYYRDPADPFASGLSDAAAFTILP